MSELVKSFIKACQSHRDAMERHPLAPLNILRSLARELSAESGMLPVVDGNDLLQAWKLVQCWLDSRAPARTLALDIWKRVPEMVWLMHNGQTAVTSLRLREGLVWAASLSVPRAGWVIRLSEAYVIATHAPSLTSPGKRLECP